MGKAPRTKIASNTAADATATPRKAKIDPLSIHDSGLPVYQVAQNWIDEIEANTTVEGRNKILAPSVSRSCPVCGHTPSSPINYELIRHGESHLAPADKQYQCPYTGCSYQGATQRCNLNNHIRSVHTKETRLCNVVLMRVPGGPTYACGWAVCDGGRMTRHRQEVHKHPKRGEKGVKKPSRVKKTDREVIHLFCDSEGKAIWPEDVVPPIESAVVESNDEEGKTTRRRTTRRRSTRLNPPTRDSPTPPPHVASSPSLPPAYVASSPCPSPAHVLPSPRPSAAYVMPSPRSSPAYIAPRPSPEYGPPTPCGSPGYVASHRSPALPSPERPEGAVVMVPYVYTPVSARDEYRSPPAMDPTKLTFPPLRVPDGVLRPLSPASTSTPARYSSQLPIDSPYLRAGSSAESSLRDSPSYAGPSSGYSWQDYASRRGGEYSASPSPRRYMPYPSRESYARAGPSSSPSGPSRLSGPAMSPPPIRHYPPPPPWANTPIQLKPVRWEVSREYPDYEEERGEEGYRRGYRRW